MSITPDKERNETDQIVLEIIGRKFFSLISKAGDASLISKWRNICDPTFNTEELQKLIEQGRDVVVSEPTSENNRKPKATPQFVKPRIVVDSSTVSSSTSSPSLNLADRRRREMMQPIEVIIDESMLDGDIDNQPSTSSSVLSSHADTQQDAKVYTRIGELRSAGLWSATRLPMCVEPPRPKLHWDFLVEEVLWMSADFRQERRIKRRLARKLCSEAKQVWRKKFDSKINEVALREKEAKRVCASIARMIKEFWINVDKVVDFRTKEILESQKRKALDQHLTFLVGEADKLSTLLHKRLANNDGLCGEANARSPAEDFHVGSSDEEEDDERTIELEERRVNKAIVDAELNELSQLADLDDDDFFKSLPEGYLEKFYRGRHGKAPSVDNSDSMEVDEANSSGSATTTTTTRTNNATVVEEEPADKVVYSNLKSDNQEVRRQELNNIANVASEFQPKGNTLETTQVKTEVPFLIRGELREYQLVGLDWLVTLYEKNLNGILADEMGLGKTIQTIALIAHLACEKMIWGPHLIIVPTSVILNWEMEFKKWCPALKILTYFGSAKERAEKRKGWTKENVFHVCITSYNIATQDIKALKSKAWQYIILDEAQNIKNFKSQRWQTLLNIRSLRRLLLTGTPLQNSLMELWSLLHFLMPSVFASHEDFKDWFSNPMNSMVEGNIDVDKALVQRLHKVLRPFILRRLKSEVERQLPTKQEKVVSCPLSKRQRFLYNEFLSKKDTRENLQSGNMMSVLNVIMQLRKCCNHPNLFEPRPVLSPLVVPALRLKLPSQCRIHGHDDEERGESPVFLKLPFIKSLSAWTTFERVSDAERESDGTTSSFLNDNDKRLPKLNGLKFSVRDHTGFGAVFFKNSTIANNHNSASSTETIKNNGIFSSKINDKRPNDSLKSPLVLKNGRKRPLISEMENAAGETGNKPAQSKRACRLTNLCADIHRRRRDEMLRIGKWLSATRRTKGAPVLADEFLAFIRRVVIDDDDENNNNRMWTCKRTFSSDGGPFERVCELISSRISSWLRTSIRSFVLYIIKVLSNGPLFDVHLKPFEQCSEFIMEQSSRRYLLEQSECSEVIRISHQLQFPELRLIEYDCGKLQTLSKLLKQLYENKHRCLIFTQMSRMLDILQAFLSYYSYKYFRLDGSTHIDQRHAMMERFNNDSSIFCFILSTRSGGVGVNLTGADTVIFYDSDWNPTMDAQAQDRCHRIGQTRNVTIYRLISEKTIEENILKKANQKRRLGEMTLDEAEFTPQFFRSVDNIRDLFSNEESVAELVAPFASNPVEIEQAMANAEDQQDVLAAKQAQAETFADVAEFDDTIQRRPSSGMSQAGGTKTLTMPVDQSQSSGSKYLNDVENASEQYIELISGMTPVERYAISFLENEYRPELEEEFKETAALIEARKENYLKSGDVDADESMDVASENGELVSRIPNNVKLVQHDTYDEDILKEVFFPSFAIDAVPMWMPPSPPNSEAGEIEIRPVTWDDALMPGVWKEEFALYEPRLIPESKLPPLPVASAKTLLSHNAIPSTIISRKFSATRDEPRRPQKFADEAHRNTIGKTSNKSTSRRHFADEYSSSTKKSRYRDYKMSDASRRSETPVYSSQSPSPRCATPGGDLAMLAELNNAGAATAAAAVAARLDGPQKIDECIERVRRNSTQRTLVSTSATTQIQQPKKPTAPLPESYISASGPPESRRDLVYFPQTHFSSPSSLGGAGGSAVANVARKIPPFSRRVANGELVAPNGGFAPPASHPNETEDPEEGMRWHMNEDCRLLEAILLHTKLTTQTLDDTCLELNWEFVSHYVNMNSPLQYRSPRSCYHRYESFYMKNAKLLKDGRIEGEMEKRMTKLYSAYGQYYPNSLMTAYYRNDPNGQSAKQQSPPPPLYIVHVDEKARERQNRADIQRRMRAVIDSSESRDAVQRSPFDLLMRRVATRALQANVVRNLLPS